MSDTRIESQRPAESRVQHLVHRIPDPLTLTQWARLFRMAALLLLATVPLGLLFLFFSDIPPGTMLSAGPDWAIYQLRLAMQILVLFAAADLLRHLSGSTDQPALGRRLGHLLLALSAAEAVLLVRNLILSIHYLRSAGRPAFLVELTVAFVWPVLYMAAAMIALRYLRLLQQIRVHALPSIEPLLQAIRFPVFHRPVSGRVASLILICVGSFAVASATVQMVFHLHALFTNWFIGMPAGASRRGELGLIQLLGECHRTLLPGLILIALAVWNRPPDAPSRWSRLGESLPLLLWLTAALKLLQSLLGYVLMFDGQQVLSFLLGLVSVLPWLLALAGAGYAMRYLSRTRFPGEESA